MPGKKAFQAIPNTLLKQARLERGWAQKDVADSIGTSTQNVIRWERGTSTPSAYAQQKLCALFGMTPKQLGFLREQVPSEPFDPTASVFDPAIPSPFADPQDFVGRNELLRSLKQRLCAGESVVLTALNGIPGVGKTALAIELAHDSQIRKHFRDGVLWADLGRHPSSIGVLGRWGKLLGLSESEMEKLRDYDVWAVAIRAAIGTRQMLLVIDDAWKAEEALAFVLGGPTCAYIVTTRLIEVVTQLRRGQIRLESLSVPELSEDDGVKLLQRLIPTEAQAEPEWEQDARALVRAVGGLPLALILIGSYLFAQTYHHQPRRIQAALAKLRNIEERLQLAQPQGGLNRYRNIPQGASISLEAAIGISDEVLDEVARQTLRALSLFPPKPNTFSEEAALTVAASSGEALDHLVDAGLVEFSRQNRYTLHQTIADYAKIKHKDTADEQRFAEYFAGFLEQHETDYQVLEQEVSNVQTAIQITSKLGLHEVLVRGVIKFYPFLESRGLYRQAEDYLKQAQAIATSLDDKVDLVSVLLNLGRVGEKSGDYAQAEAYLQEGLDLARQLGHRERIATSLLNLGVVAARRGDYERMEAYLQEGLELYRQLGHRERIATSLQNLGVAAISRGDYERAEAYFQEGLDLARQLGHRERITATLQCLGELAANKGDYERAEPYLQEGLDLARQLGHRELIATSLYSLGELATKRGDYERAEPYLQEGLDLARQLGHRELIAVLLQSLSEVVTNRGDYPQAEAYLQEGLDLARQLGHRERIAYLLYPLGELATKRGDYERAEAYLQEGLDLARQLGHRPLIAIILHKRGELQLKLSRRHAASKDFREALEAVPQESRDLKADILFGLAQIEATLGNYNEARRQGEISLDIFEKIGHKKASEVREWLTMLPLQDGGVEQ